MWAFIFCIPALSWHDSCSIETTRFNAVLARQLKVKTVSKQRWEWLLKLKHIETEAAFSNLNHLKKNKTAATVGQRPEFLDQTQMPTCSTDDGIWCCSRCDISSPHIARWKWLRCRCLPRCVLCEACSHTPCPSCGATEDGKLLELDDAVSFSASSSFVSDITDDSNLADMLWQILSRAVKGWSTNDLRQACGLRKADDLIALLSRWENKKIVVQVGSTCKEENAVQSLWWTSAKYKHVIEEERTRIYYRLQVQLWEGLRRRMPCAVDGCILGNEKKNASLLSTLAEATDLSTINLLTDGHVIEHIYTCLWLWLVLQFMGIPAPI